MAKNWILIHVKIFALDRTFTKPLRNKIGENFIVASFCSKGELKYCKYYHKSET
jgi:hypothetical protein